MAVRESVTPKGAATRRAWFVAACLVVLFVAALFLRAYWNLDAANPSEGEFILSGGSDPYYHKRAVDAIQAGGFQHYLQDPLLNYPRGSENPNPPLYQWSIAVSGKLLEPFFDPATRADGAMLSSLEVATWHATIWSPAIYGALTVIVVYAIGAALFDRRAGLVAALLWTVATSAVDAGGVGLADHDSAVIFFVTLSFLFYIQAIRHFRGDGNWVVSWSQGDAIGSGLGRLMRERATGFAYAGATAFSIAAVALTWKGFNYVIGIIFLYAILQMVLDHWRNKDSTGLFLASFVAIAGGVIVALPYYLTANVGNFLQPTWFILAAFAIAGVVLVPTRDLPTILVFPIALGVGIVLAIAAFFVFPEVARSLLYATVYFKQTRLYETIAEAHPADFSTIAFGVGPLPFFAALAGWFVLLFTVRQRTTRPVLFALLWGAVAVFMAQSAVRFLINAIPVFCVFAGFMTIWVLDWLDFGAIRKSLAANRGNAWQGFRRGVRPLHIIAVVLIALLFVFPTTILAADAALPPEGESRLASESESEFVKRFFNERMGAYGQGFGQVKPWIPAFEFLKEHDANISDPAERPAFISWWDYGHWAIAISQHPAVADNFQNGYELAANFILSQDEAHSIQLLAMRLAEAPGADVEGALTAAGSSDVAADAATIRDCIATKVCPRLNLTIDQSATLLESMEESTGKSIRYFATDIRMLPYDNPQTSSIEASSIYYAPVKLKGDEPDDYVTTEVNVGTPVTVNGVRHDDGHLSVPEYRTLARDPIRRYEVVGERYVYQDSFFNSAYWRHYVGTPVPPSGTQATTGERVDAAVNNPRPGYGLEHFRAIYIGQITRLYRGGDPTDLSSFLYYPEIVLTEYYRGAVVTGTVTEGGSPLAGVKVTVFDDVGRLLAERFGGGIENPDQFNVPHQEVTTGADGSFRILAPFALEGGNVTLVATRGDVVLGSTSLAITREDAQTGRAFPGIEISVARGSVNGIAFRDANADGRFDAANETPVAGVDISIGGKTATTAADGSYSIADVPAGPQEVTTNATDFDVAFASGRVTVRPGETSAHDVGLSLKQATISGNLVAQIDGADQPIAFEPIVFTPDADVADNTAVATEIVTTADGNYTLTLAPGSYVVTVSYTPQGSTDVYEVEERIALSPGQTLADREIRLAQASSP